MKSFYNPLRGEEENTRERKLSEMEEYLITQEEEENLTRLVKRGYKIVFFLVLLTFLIFNTMAIFIILLLVAFWKITEWLFIKERSGCSP